MPGIPTSLNLDKALQYAPPKEIMLDDAMRIPTDWMERLFQLIAKSNPRYPLEKHVGSESNYRAKTALIKQLKLVYCRLAGLFDKQLGVLLNTERDAYLSKLSEGVMNCSEGFHARVMEVLFAMQKPERFEQLVHLAREVIVEEARIWFLHDDVHRANQVTIVAMQAGFGVRARLLGDRYAESHDDRGILEKLNKTFSEKFTPYHLPNLICDQMRNVFHDQEYEGEKSVEVGGYNGHLIERFGKLIECFLFPEKKTTLHFSYYAQQYFIKEEDDYFLDINWKKIRLLIFKKLLSNDYFNHLQPENIFDFWMSWNFIPADFEIEKNPLMRNLFCEDTIEITLRTVIDRLFEKDEFDLLNQAYQSSPENFHWLITHPDFVKKLQDFKSIIGLLHHWEELDLSLQRLLLVRIQEIKLTPESSWCHWLLEIKNGAREGRMNKIKLNTACFILTALQDVYYDALLKKPDDLRNIFCQLGEFSRTTSEVSAQLIGNAFFKLLENCSDIPLLWSILLQMRDGKLAIYEWFIHSDVTAHFSRSLENLSEKLIKRSSGNNFAKCMGMAALLFSEGEKLNMRPVRRLALLNVFLERMVEFVENFDGLQFIEMCQNQLNGVTEIYWIVEALLAVEDKYAEKVLSVTQRIASQCNNDFFVKAFFMQVNHHDTALFRLMKIKSTSWKNLKTKNDVILQLLAQSPNNGLRKTLENDAVSSLFLDFCSDFIKKRGTPAENELNESTRILHALSARKFDEGEKLLNPLIEISGVPSPFDDLLRVCFFQSNPLESRNCSTLAVFQNLFNLYPDHATMHIAMILRCISDYYVHTGEYYSVRTDSLFDRLAFFSGCQFPVTTYQNLVDILIKKRELLLKPMRQYLKQLNELSCSNAESIQYICRRGTVFGALIDYVLPTKTKSRTGIRQLVDTFILAKLAKGSAPYLAIKLACCISEKMVSLRTPSFFCASIQLSRDEMQDLQSLNQLIMKIADGISIDHQEKHTLSTLSKKLEEHFSEKEQLRLEALNKLCCGRQLGPVLQMNGWRSAIPAL